MPLHRRACTSAYAFFAESMHAFTSVVDTMHVRVCMLDRCCEHQRTHLLHTRYRMYICAMYMHVYVHICVCICICMHVYIYIYVYIHIYMLTCIYIYIHKYLYVYV